MIQLSGLLWPVHLKPRPDELLSSWLMRLTRAYATVPHTFTRKLWPDLAVWNRDLDRLAPPEIIRDLAQHTGVSIQRAFGTTLRAYEGIVFEALIQNGMTPWILPLQIWHRLHLRHGQQYCPACLDCDDPYFRRRWRLSLVTGCTEHGLVLLDRCVHCGAPINFHRAAYWIPRFTSCHKCGEDLASTVQKTTKLDLQELRAQRHLQYTISRGFVDLPDAGPVYSHLYLLGYRAFCRVLMSSRGRCALVDLTRDHDLPAVDMKNHVEENLDFAPIALRRHVLLAAWKAFRSWPDGFIEVCHRYGLRGSDFRRDGQILPYWMHFVVQRNIDRPFYCTNVEELTAAIRYMDSHDIRVTPRSAYHLLGRASAKTVDRYLEALQAARVAHPRDA